MLKFAEGKKILFITTKNLDYIRNTQEIEELESAGTSLSVIGSSKKSYPLRLLYVFRNILTTSMKSYDLVFIGFAPQLILPFWAFKFKRNEVAIDFFISMYDTLVCDRKKFGEKSFPAKMLKHIDKRTLKKADYIIVDTNAHGRYFAEELGADRKKLQVLYLNADSSVYYPRKAVREARLKDKFVVLYFGSILPLQGVDIVLEAIELLKEKENIFFYMIGPIGDKLKKPETGNVEYITWLSQPELAEHIAASDLCLAGHFNSEINKAKRTIPGKAYIYEAMHKPMVLGDNEATRERYDEAQEGIYFVEMGSAQALAEIVEKLSELS